MCSSHITFAENALREQEISAISKVIAKRAKKEDEVYIFLGDMNIDNPDDPTMAALTNNGFNVPLFGTTNLVGGKHFDQITFTGEDIKTNLIRHGVFDWQGAVYKSDDVDFYKGIAEEMRGKAYKNWDIKYKGWVTHEMSDHFPIWVELRVDFSDKYLKDHFL